MSANFCVLILVLSLVFYATLGGHNENGQTFEESVIYEQIIEESDLIADETYNEIETEFMDETEYVTSYPYEETEEMLEAVEAPMECSFRKPRKLIRSHVTKPCPKMRSTNCPCHTTRVPMYDEVEMEHPECPARASYKPRIVKRTIKKVIPSAKYTIKEPELQTCGPTVESKNEEASSENNEKPVEETVNSEELEKQPEVEPVKEKAGKQNEKAKLDATNKQAKQKNSKKSKTQSKSKQQQQKSGNKKANKKSKL